MIKQIREYLFFKKSKRLLKRVSSYIKKIESNKFNDKQWFLDFEDELNKLSIKDHNIK